MIVTSKDVEILKGFLTDFEKLGLESEHAAEFIALHPQVIMAPLGFDDYVALTEENSRQFRQFSYDLVDPLSAVFRKPTGRWMLVEPIKYAHEKRLRSFTLQSKVRPYQVNPEEILVEDLLSELERCVEKTVDAEKRLWTPLLWTPETQERQRLALANSVSKIMEAIRSEKMELRDLSWSQLEELVAEVLRGLGLQIHLVRERPQGGRDLIARGELLPGQEPLELAVEVKHKPVVGRPEVQTALWQNRMYPALLFVTSGRFSAGVLQEKTLPENRLRLFLKDGEALNDLVYGYLRRDLITARRNAL